jgi:hypothetical protein
MNKLLQHIIDAGDVDHKVLPGLQKMQKGSYQEELPKAQWGSFVNPVTIAGAATLFAKAKEFFGFDEPKIVRTPASAPKRLSIRDPRKIMMTTGKPLRPNSDLVTGEYDSEHLGNLLTEAKRRKMSYNDMMNLAAMGFQETKWGRSDDNIGHTKGDFGDEPMQDTYSNFINAYNAKMKDADRLKIKDEATRLQVYNGLGKVFPSTEADYHGFKMKKIYGVEVPKGGIDLRKNPLYGKQVMDIRDNVLKRNPEFMRYMDSTYRAPIPKEEEFANGGLFKVFAQEGLEYKGPSIVDYLATKGYSGNKAFRKELAEKYGIEGYNFSAAKNTELLNRLRENDDLLEQNYQPTQAAIPVERMMEMESQARAARQAAAQSAPQQPAQRPVNPGNYYTYSPDYGDMRIPQPKINTSLQPKVKYDKFSLSPQMVIPLPFGFGKQTPSEIPNSEITDPVRNVSAKPKVNLPQYNPFVKPVAKPELGPFNSERYNDVQEVDPVNQQGAPEFLFNSEKLFNSFNRPKQKPLLPVVIPAKKPVVKTEKYTKPEVEELPWYEEAANAVTNTLKGFYDDFAESVEKSPFDFRGMNFGTPVSPQGATEMTRDLTKRGLSLFSPDMAEKYNNWLNRQQAIKNMDKDPVSKIVVPDFDYAPMYITGDTIPDAGGRQYHIPESMDLNALKFGVRNRGDFTPIDTEAASITAFHPFVDSKLYFTQIADDPANATYLGITPDGQVQVGGRKDVENKDIKITRVFSNKVVDFIKDPTGGIKKVPAGAKVNKNAFSPAVTVIGDDGKQKEGKLNLVVPQGTKADDAFGVATGGRFIFQTPDGQSRLVSGSLSNIEQEFKRIKGKNPYVTVISLDNGSFSRGLRTFDKRLTSVDLRSYDNLNSGGGNFAYLLPNQQTSRPLAKFDEFEKEATKRLQALYPGKKVSVEYQDTGLYNQTGGRDIQTQADIQKKGNSQTPVSLHNFNAARDYVLYVDGKPISGDQSNKAGNNIYKEVLWKAADKTGVYHVEDWDVGHIGLAKEGQKTAFDELKSKYPEIFTDPNFVKSLEFINKNKSNPTYAEYYELLNNIQPFTGQPRTTEFMKRSGTAKKQQGGLVNMQMAGQYLAEKDQTNTPINNKVAYMQHREDPVFLLNSIKKGANNYVNDQQEKLRRQPQFRQDPGFLEKALMPLDVATDVMQLGNFIPDINAQAVGKFGNWIGAGVDATQAALSAKRGDYLTAALNASSLILPAYFQKQGFTRTSKFIPDNSILGKLRSSTERTKYMNVGNRVKGQTPMNLLANRAALGTLGVETAYDLDLMGPVKKENGGPILDPRGQWAHPGKVTRIPGSDITMQGVNYPVLGIGNNGKKQMMYPGQEYNFGGASYVDEYPMMQKGGWSGGGLSRYDLATMAALNKNINSKKKYAHNYDTRKTIEDVSLEQGYKDMSNFMKYWLTERASDPNFSEWANKRLSVLNNVPNKYKSYTNKDIETGKAPYNSQAFYSPKDSSLNFNTDEESSFSAPTQIHELSHKMDYEDNVFYKQPRYFWDSLDYTTPSNFISKQLIPKTKEFTNNRFAGKQDEYSYLSNPTEINARLNEFRYQYNLDPKKKYTAEDMKKIINDHNNYKGSLKNIRDELFKSKENSLQSLDDLLKILGNDPKKLADLHNQVVKNKTFYASDAMPQAKNGGYTVTRSNDRKGKTHKVTGPDGTVKYFGDSKLGQHPKDPERKKAFYARHKKNLAGNPFFRAFARKTWEEGGQTDYMQGGGLWDTDKVAYLDSTVNANRNLEFIRRAIENDGLSIPTPKGAPGYGKGMTSSHLMTYDPKSRRSYPELVNINGTLKYLTGDDAYNYAEDTGEYIQFPTAEQANYFSKNYKKSNYVKVGKQPLEKKHGIKVTYKK